MNEMDEHVSATALIDAPPEVIFSVLADPATHAAIDGTGWVRDALDSQPLTAEGQTFRMAMYHKHHPDGGYQIVNRVLELDPPRSISWEPGYEDLAMATCASAAGLGATTLKRLGLQRPTSRFPMTGLRPQPQPVSTSSSHRSLRTTSATRWPISPNWPLPNDELSG
jgi:uncharacterized protein YndB with AHSA1/START domain